MKPFFSTVVKFILVFILGLCSLTFLKANCPSDLTFSSQAQINNFPNQYPNCTEITGNLSVTGLYNTITDLSPLSQLNSVGGTINIQHTDCIDLSGLDNISYANKLHIASNDLMLNFNGLGSLSEIGAGGIHMQHQAALEDFAGLESLENINGKIFVALCPSISSLRGLDNLENVGASITIAGCNALTSLDNLNSLETVGSQLAIHGCTALTDLDGLNNLVSTVGLSLYGNTSLSDLSALSSLTDLGSGGLIVRGCTSLSSLSGLDNIDHSTFSGIVIMDNNQLSECAVSSVCGHVLDNGSSTISGNTGGCGSASAVEAACLTALPVEMLQFDVFAFEKHNSIIWATASEANNKGFYVQRSKDGVHWEDLSFVEGQGNSNQTNHYSFDDLNSAKGMSYYRLLQLDIDGTQEYSEVRGIHREGMPITIYPNPASDYLYLDGDTERDWIRIYNAQGVLVQQGEMLQRVDIRSLKGGFYFIEFENTGQIQRFVVK